MAEQIVFGDDLDNVTVKNINGKLTAVVNVEDAEDEFEVVTDYVEPKEDDDYYVESVVAKFRHKATQFLADAYKKEKKPRSAPVSESLDRQITALISVSSDNIRITPEGVTGSPVSNIDGKRIGYFAYNSTNVSITLNKNDYSNAKAFNEAFSGKAFTVTTKKRYAESEGHPVVKPTEIQVAYPTLPYVEKTLNPTTSHDAYTVGIDLSLIDGTEPADVIQNIRLIEEEGKSKTFTVHYTLRKNDGRELTGTHTFTGWYSFYRREVADYGNNDDVTYERWEFEPFVLEGFYAKFTVNPQPYVEGTL